MSGSREEKSQVYLWRDELAGVPNEDMLQEVKHAGLWLRTEVRN